MDPRADVRNAADPQQVKRAGRKERDRDARKAWALRRVLEAPEGRLLVWELLADAGVFRSIWHPSAAIHYNAGRQDFGHELMAAVIALDSGETFALMQREQFQLAKRDQDERDAAHHTGSRDGGSNG